MEEKTQNKNKTVKRIISAVVAVFVVALSFTGGYFTRYATEDKDIRSIRYILDCYKKYYYFEQDDVVDIIAGALLDQYSAYYTKEEYELVQKASKGQREGIGVSVSKATTEIVEVSGNSPAEKAGVKAGGIIVSVDGNTVENYEDFDKLLGAIEPYADLVLGVDYGGETKCFTLQKQEYTQTYVFYHDDTVYSHFTTNGSGKVVQTDENLTADTDIIDDEDTGYLKLSMFYGFTGETYVNQWKNNVAGAAGQFYSALQTFKQNGKHNLIVDLRGNGGGYVIIAQSIAAHLLESQDNKTPLFSVQSYKDGKKEKYYTANTDYSGYGFKKIIFLADENSASASEMLMGAVLDYDAKNGTNIVNVVLEQSLDKNGNPVYKSYGKGIMQEHITNYLTGEVVVMTVAKLFWPISGVCIHGVGLTHELDERIIESKDGAGNPVDALVTAKNLIAA